MIHKLKAISWQLSDLIDIRIQTLINGSIIGGRFITKEMNQRSTLFIGVVSLFFSSFQFFSIFHSFFFDKVRAIVSVSSVQLCGLRPFFSIMKIIATSFYAFSFWNFHQSLTECQTTCNRNEKYRMGLPKKLSANRRCIQMLRIWLCVEMNSNNISININIFSWHYFSNRSHYSHMMQLSSALIHLNSRNVDTNLLMRIATHSILDMMMNRNVSSSSSSTIIY